jgi:peroxiredoxin
MTTQKRLAVGDQVPMFTLPSSLGRPVWLAERLADGPVVVAWYLFDFGRV